ncbi:DNA topoisomerase III [Azohydromonas caseinilytica]|uniref:DNA topoisomerase n=1 Tax=Azohydromonas caseinilytica TaxID=2728836 RepID=A0A848FF84_9BURK|nr:DNA topoisomerase III [Azohydromonas caseinilytica]NML17942.1 DNA topoisomerase III [Azohydromonas caseinilytica]
MKTLIVAEKPSVAADIAQALGGFTRRGGYFERSDLLVASARGHLVQLGVRKDDDPGFNLARLPVIPQRFALEALPGTQQTLDLLRQLAGRSDVERLINACDAGREGELIFRLIVEYLRVRKPIERMWLQTMTATGIKQAYAQRRSDADMRPLAAAARSRAEADWLVGVNATRALTKANLVAPGELVSAGRVQTPTLALLVDREEEIRSFEPRDFWEVIATLSVAAGSWQAKWFDPAFKPNADPAARADRTFDRSMAETVQQACSGVTPNSVKDSSKPVRRNPPKLYDLTTLQRDANARHGFSAKTTLSLAQALYEQHKVLTYPRTDSNHLPEDYPPKVAQVLKLLPQGFQPFAQAILGHGWLTPRHPVFDNRKISDHFAIIPTGKAPTGLSEAESRIYDLVVRRFLAAFHPPAEYLETTRLAEIAGYRFRATGRVLVSAGWLAVYGGEAASAAKEKGKDAGKEVQNLPAMRAGEPVSNDAVTVRTGQTTPPPRFTEASLLAAMENAGKLVDDDALAAAMKERGLGTPATRANTIEELLSEKKRYLERHGKELVPTGKGIRLIQSLRDNGLVALASPELTGDWESRLARIERGQETREAFMAGIAGTTQDLVARIRAKAVAAPAGAAGVGAGTGTDIGCRCGQAKLQERPKSWGCPSCGLTIWKEMAGRKTRKTDVKALCKSGHTPVLDGFTSKAGKKFSAALRLAAGPGGGKVEFAFDDRGPAPRQDARQDLSRQSRPDTPGRATAPLQHAAPGVQPRRPSTGSRGRKGSGDFEPPPH